MVIFLVIFVTSSELLSWKPFVSLFRQLFDQSNNIQPVLDITCSLGHPGGRGQRLNFKVNLSFRADRGLPMIQTTQYHILIKTKTEIC